MKVLLVCVVFVQLTWAKAVPKPCCVPDQWEAALGADQVTSSGGQPISTSRVTNLLSTDFTNKRQAITSLYDGRNRWGKTIFDFIKKKQYAITEDECTVYPLEFEMPSPCIPATAVHLGSSYLGGGSKIPFDSWSYSLPQYNSNITISLSQEDCTPLVEEVSSRNGDFRSLLVGAFTSFTLGIKDPKVFVPPPSCNEAVQKVTSARIGHSAHPTQY